MGGDPHQGRYPSIPGFRYEFPVRRLHRLRELRTTLYTARARAVSLRRVKGSPRGWCGKIRTTARYHSDDSRFIATRRHPFG